MLSSRFQGQICRTSDHSLFEWWDGEQCVWREIQRTDLHDRIDAELVAVWAPRRPTRPGMQPQPIPVPLADSSFKPRMYNIITNTLPFARTCALDADCRHKLLFPAGDGRPSMVYDFNLDVVREAAPEDRLRLHVKRPWRDFADSAALQRLRVFCKDPGPKTPKIQDQVIKSRFC